MNTVIKYIGLSHKGIVRRVNQDNLVCDRHILNDDGNLFYVGGESKEQGVIFGVFDGMGGLELGEAASKIAAECFMNACRKNVCDVCESVNKAVREKGNEWGANMGTTAAVMVSGRDGFTVANVGDSRVYLSDRHGLRRISVDDTSEAVPGKKPPLTQYLGMSDDMKLIPHICTRRYFDEDVYLICSDGLCDMVTEDDISGILKSIRFEDAAMALLDKALEGGGRDNITLILLKVQKQSMFAWKGK